MKRLIISALVVFLMVAPVYAGGTTKDNCGCGLGSMIFEGQNSLVTQVFAATTNVTCGNQTFGITSGTLGCESADAIVKNEVIDRFVAENMDNLAVEIAAGQGESLDTLVELINLPNEKRSGFYTALQSNFGTIYPSTEVTHRHVIEKIAHIVKEI